MEDQEKNSFRKIFLGSIEKKLIFSFGILILLLVGLIILTYTINKQIEQDQIALKEIEAPLEVMVQQVISYDAGLTGTVYEALLYAEKSDFEKLTEHINEYNELGVKLDELLKYQARDLLMRSKRSDYDKTQALGYLADLDLINLKLVDLELGAFEAMQNGNVELARSLVVSNQYSEYKQQLADLYSSWDNLEKRVSDEYRLKILINSRNVMIYNVLLGILFVLISVVIAFFVIRGIAKPLKKLILAVRELEKKNFNAKVDIQTGDELETLGKSFNKTMEVLNNLDVQQKQVDKAKTEFLSITSHELRSPMTPMRAQLQMLNENYFGKLSNKQREALTIVLNNTERLDKIIVDFLEISRIEAARLKFNFTKVDLRKTISKLIVEMKGFMPEKKITIENKIKKLPIIEVDADRVGQVLRNLINNAIKFSPENGKIIVGGEKKAGKILFYVKDNGIGILPKDQVRLFEPFYQVDNMYQHKSGGTGLGLAICRGIVESQGGKIWLESGLDMGTTFYFTVPLKPIRVIKPLKLLFSPQAEIDEKMKKVFISHLGPIGEEEFNLVQRELNVESIRKYIQMLVQKGVLDKELGEEFKKDALLIFGKEKRELSDSLIDKKRGKK